ncbi:MAG: DUF3782 domain-containing protein [Desulfobacterales bacterium]|nr:DUF3782 domain-containing protein [Desulfobacterales bacterium]
MMILTDELRDTIINTINHDAGFGFDLYQALLKSVSDDLVTKTYLDEALAKHSREFDKKLNQLTQKFDEKLAQQTKSFDEKLSHQTKSFDEKLAQQTKSFDEKLAQQTKAFDEKLEELSRKFDEKLAQLTKEFDEKLFMQSQDLKRYVDDRLREQSQDLKKFFKDYVDAKLGRIGSRWGEDAENAIREFAQRLISQWGAKVKKWKKTVKFKDEMGYVYQKRYEIDIVVRNGITSLIEIKANCDMEDMERFTENIDFYMHTDGKEQEIHKIMVTFDIDERVKKMATNMGIEIIDGLT